MLLALLGCHHKIFLPLPPSPQQILVICRFIYYCYFRWMTPPQMLSLTLLWGISKTIITFWGHVWICLKTLPGMSFICHHLCSVFKWILIEKDLKEPPKPSHLFCSTNTPGFFLSLNTTCYLGCQRGSWGAFSLFRTETFEQLIHQLIALPFSASFGTCADDEAWGICRSSL